MSQISCHTSHVRERQNCPAQLRNALVDEWNNIPVRTENALVNSIQRRIRAAAAARVGHTRYLSLQLTFHFQLYGEGGGTYQ